MAEKIRVIEAAHYGEARARLAKDEIVIAMAAGLAGVDRAELCHDDGGVRFEFMGVANAEYEKRGGKDHAHLGAVAEALIMVLDGKGGEA
jgi:hypothetical protein